MKAATVVLGASFSLLFASPAFADVFTPALKTGAALDVDCRVVNITTTQMNNVTIEIKDAAGVVNASLGPISIAGGTSVSVTDPGPPSVAYCQVRNVSPSKVRVSLCLTDNFTPFLCTTAP